MTRGNEICLRRQTTPPDWRTEHRGIASVARRSCRQQGLLPGCGRPNTIAAGCGRFISHAITSPDVFRQRYSVIRLTRIATSRNEIECGRAAIAMPIFYGGGRVAAAIELTVGVLGSELTPAAGTLSVACRSLLRQLATEFCVRDAETDSWERWRSRHPDMALIDDERQNPIVRRATMVRGVPVDGQEVLARTNHV
jgi:Bacterial transcriptional regulator